MIYQARRFTCGPASLHNALNFLYGKSAPSEEQLSLLAGTDTEGTGAHQMKLALKSLGIPFKTHSFKGKAKAHHTLWTEHFQSQLSIATVAYCNKREHWFTLVDVVTNRSIVIDSADPDLIVRWSTEKLMDEWGRDASGKEHRYYSIVIGA